MTTDPQLVEELRTLFKRGATPSALVRRIAERHEGEPMLDRTVRDYFRAAFDWILARIGPELVAKIRGGEGVPALNVSVLHQIIKARSGWDVEAEQTECWLDAVPAIPVDDFDLAATPELVGSWEQMDDRAKAYIRRTIANARDLSNRLNALAALAEELQQQVEAATRPLAPAAT